MLASSTPMVMGPTPPGTGVMAPAVSMASAVATSPTSLALGLPSGPGSPSMRLIPTSMTVAPGLIQSPLIISGRPTAATRISARRQTSGRFLVRAVRRGDGAVGTQQKLAHGFADDVGAADDDSVESGQVTQMILQQHQTAERGTGHQRRLGPLGAGHEAAGIDDMEAVDVLVRVDGIDDGLLVDLVGQWQLHQDAVHGRVVVQFLDLGQQRLLAGAGVHLVLIGVHAGFDGLFALGADVDLTGRIFAHENDGQPWGSGHDRPSVWRPLRRCGRAGRRQRPFRR